MRAAVDRALPTVVVVRAGAARGVAPRATDAGRAAGCVAGRAAGRAAPTVVAAALSLNAPTMLLMVRAWLSSSFAALADSSAFAATRGVTTFTCPTATSICATPCACCSLAAALSPTTPVAFDTWALICSKVASTSPFSAPPRAPDAGPCTRQRTRAPTGATVRAVPATVEAPRPRLAARGASLGDG